MDKTIQEDIDLFKEQLRQLECLPNPSNSIVKRLRGEVKVFLLQKITELESGILAKTLILAEDDCAPDSRRYFNDRMIFYCGLGVDNFKGLGIRYERHEGMTIGWQYEDFFLEISADDPHYKLYQLNKKEESGLTQ